MGKKSNCIFVNSTHELCVIRFIFFDYRWIKRKYFFNVESWVSFKLIIFIATIANMGIPGSSSFISEFLILIGLIKTSFLLSFLSGLLLIFGVLYAIWLYNRIIFGQINKSILIVKDL